MTDGQGERKTLVFRDQHDEDGVSWRGVSLLGDGGLEISGQDLGAAVEKGWGHYEYEFTRRLTATEAKRLRELLGVEAHGDLLTKIAQTFPASSALEAFLVLNEIPGEFWSRVGD